MGGDEDDEAKQKQAEENIEIWKIKKLIKSLQLARGCAKKKKSQPPHLYPPHSRPRMQPRARLAGGMAARGAICSTGFRLRTAGCS